MLPLDGAPSLLVLRSVHFASIGLLRELMVLNCLDNSVPRVLDKRLIMASVQRITYNEGILANLAV